MPVADSYLSQFPAQANDAALVAGEEIDEANVEVFYLRAKFVHFIEGIAKLCRGSIAPGTNREEWPGIDTGAASVANALQAGFEFAVGGLIFGFLAKGITQGKFDLGEDALRFGNCKITRHSITNYAAPRGGLGAVADSVEESAPEFLHNFSMDGLNREYK